MPPQRKRPLSRAHATAGACRPASGSHDDDVNYGGSRRLTQRFEYSENSGAASVERIPSWTPLPEEFKRFLEAVPLVVEVNWHSSKTSQKNVGNHDCERNLIVYSGISPDSARRPIEFELTRHQHKKEVTGAPMTLTAMFKDPPKGLLSEAWRILLAVTKDKQLLPDHVEDYRKRHVARWEGVDSVSDSNPVAPATDSPPWKRDKRVVTPRGSVALVMSTEAEAATASPLAASPVLAPGLLLESFCCVRRRSSKSSPS